MSFSLLTRRMHTPAAPFFRSSLFALRPIPQLVHHRLSSSRPPSEDLADDSDPLHYHPFPSLRPPRLALSFLPYPPHSIKSATILGSLPMDEEQADLSSFTENAAFRDIVLDRAVRESLEQGEERVKNEAQGRIEGWVHINDDRNYPMPGRIGDPSDLIGSVYVEGGEVQAKTYTPMPSYRVLTSDGPTKLSEGMHAKLIEVLERVHEQEGNTQGGEPGSGQKGQADAGRSNNQMQ